MRTDNGVGLQATPGAFVRVPSTKGLVVCHFRLVAVTRYSAPLTMWRLIRFSSIFHRQATNPGAGLPTSLAK